VVVVVEVVVEVVVDVVAVEGTVVVVAVVVVGAIGHSVVVVDVPGAVVGVPVAAAEETVELVLLVESAGVVAEPVGAVESEKVPGVTAAGAGVAGVVSAVVAGWGLAAPCPIAVPATVHAVEPTRISPARAMR
jgi:hypothetical protein